MMSGADLALRIKFDGSAVAPGLNRMKEEIRSTAAGISSIFRSMVAPIAVSISSAAGLSQLVAVTREFDKLSAGLITATGSAAGAKESFAAIQEFAANTPYDIAQTTESFIKLVNFGLTPSERAMRSYGNTASSLGKGLNQMIEAVADAATGEFERLKEFGIKASKEGDKVKFTFRGVKTEIGNNAREIEDYLIKLGENNFGDAMANRMSTLDGAISNIGDAWDTLLRTVSGNGIGNAIADGVREGSAALDELTAKIDSGELDGYLQASAIAWAGWKSDIQKAIESVGAIFDSEMDIVGVKGKTTAKFLSDAFTQFPENVRALVGIATVELIAKFDEWEARAVRLKDSYKAIFTDDTRAAAFQRMDEQLKIIATAREETIRDILSERDTAIKSSDDQIAAAKKLREEYDKSRAAAKADKSDKLEKFKFKAADDKDNKDKNGKDKDKDFSDKSSAQFVEKDGEWVQVPTGEQSTPKADDEKAKQQADYKKELAEKNKVLTAEEFKAHQAEWKTIEAERALTKEEAKQKKAEEAKFKKEDAERNKLARDIEREAEKKAAAARERSAAENQAEKEARTTRQVPATNLPASAEDKAALDAFLREAESDSDLDTEAGGRKTRRNRTSKEFSAESPSPSDAARKQAEDREREEAEQKQSAEDFKKQEEERATKAKQAEEAISAANDERIAAAKKKAEEWAQTEAKAIEKTKSAYQQYADKVKSLQADIYGREKSLASELGELDNRGTAESKWRKQAKEAKDYEKAAKSALAAGDLTKALVLSDQAKEAYKSLKGGAGAISGEQAQRTAYSGVKMSGELGLAVSKMMMNDVGKQIKVDLGPAGAQLAAAAGQTAQGGGKTAATGAPVPPSRVVELRFNGGSVHGDEASAEALLREFARAGLSA